MSVKINMPKLSDTMEEGVLHKWNVKEGDKVSSGDVIAEVETDKATMEVEVFDSGTILKILVDEGDSVPLGETMAIIGEEGEDVDEGKEEGDREAEGKKKGEEQEAETDDEEAEESGENQEEETKEEKDETGEEESKEVEKENTEDQEQKSESKGQSTKESTDDGRIKASPLAKKMAEEQGIDLSKVNGSGPEGRIIKKDIENYEPAGEGAVSSREDTEHKVSQMRKTIARRLSESKFGSPHFYETVNIDAKALFNARKKLNDALDDKISFGNIIMKACAMALRKHPQVNSSWKDDVILEYGDVSVAFAVAVEEGLVTPVIRNTDQKGLQQIASESKELIELSRNRKLQPEQMEGSTFTISELGMFGIESFTAIINPPNACILAVGAIRDVPVVEDGEIVPGKRMKVTLSSDHRVVDGATAAQFLNTLCTMLENPLGMLL